ncbi:MAG: VanW family protein [Parcubacteria group bacterium]|jgi:vancomycin resistance protein YoaR
MLKTFRRQLYLTFTLCLLSLTVGNFAWAESIDLGVFSTQTTHGKITKNISLKIGDTAHPLTVENIKGFIQEQEQLTYNPAYRSEIENIHFCDFKKSILCALFFNAEKESHIQKISRLSLDTDKLARHLEDLARQADRDPENATLQAEEGKVAVFSLSKNGLRLDKAKSLQILLEYFKSNATADSITLAADTVKPEISTDSIDNLGITSLIGTGTSNFAGSPKNRIFNIKVAVSRFNGTLIKPGEEFSFVKTLGEVDGEHGYLPELVIKGDKTEPDFGGGICQVSTTAFRAAIYSGLKITARRNHAYPVAYYNPQGMDATVYVPLPDLKFVNNTSGYILIQVKIVGTVLTFDFYGTDDGRKTTVIGPTITERNPDGSLKATFTQEVVDKNGASLINDVFNSAYDSPSKYPHPGEVLTVKPKDWSSNEWKKYKKEHNL